MEHLKDVPKNSYRIPKNSLSRIISQNPFLRKTSRKILPSSVRSRIGENYLVKESSRPSINSINRQILKQIFENDVKSLQTILGRDLPWADF